MSEETNEILRNRRIRKHRKKNLQLTLVSYSQTPLLTPKLKFLRIELIKISRSFNFFSREALLFHERLGKAQLFYTSRFVHKLATLHPDELKYVMCKIKFCGVKPEKKWRFSIASKYLALRFCLFCKPQLYKILSYYFLLPTYESLMEALKKIPFNEGCRLQVFNSLKASKNYISYVSKNSSSFTRICSLLWDVFPLNSSTLAFEYTSTTKILNNCALVFMIRSVYSDWKQPVAYYICNNINAVKLSGLIYQVILEVIKCNIRVISTICIPSDINQQAIRYLITFTKKPTYYNWSFFVCNFEIFPIFDPVSLLKQLRKLFMQYDIEYYNRGMQRMASFEAIYSFFKLVLQKGYPPKHPLNHFIGLAKHHLYPQPDFIEKKSITAIQLFSQSVAEALLSHGFNTDTAFLLVTFNHIFDSMNGRYVDNEEEDTFELKNFPCWHESKHMFFWKDVQDLFKNMNFIDPTTKTKIRSWLFEAWHLTLCNFQNVYRSVASQQIKYFTSVFSLESLHSVFSTIYIFNNDKYYITADKFKDYMKAIVFTSLKPPFSYYNPCKLDDCTFVSNLHLNYKNYSLKYMRPMIILDRTDNRWLDGLSYTDLDHETFLHISAFIAYRMAAVFRDCKKCNHFFLSQIRPVHKGVYNRFIKGVNSDFVKLVKGIKPQKYFPLETCMMHKKFLKLYETEPDKLKLTCPRHILKAHLIFYRFIIHMLARRWIKLVNVYSVQYSNSAERDELYYFDFTQMADVDVPFMV